uniref:Uncharacterized protein n=1 Tax=viral metagenome TaxID=1070528 RepID=A0A6C0DNA0_9ZZZZ
MNTEEDPLRKCDKCKITKPKSLFYKYKYCKRCHLKNYIKQHILMARIANHLNLSIDEINNIMENKIDINDSTRNLIGEHERYDEVIMYFTGHNMRDGTIITDNVIENFLDENVVSF